MAEYQIVASPAGRNYDRQYPREHLQGDNGRTLCGRPVRWYWQTIDQPSVMRACFQCQHKRRLLELLSQPEAPATEPLREVTP